MAVREILRMGNPELLRPSSPIHDPTDPNLKSLIEDMKESLEAVRGNGLAAPQIGIAIRLVLYRLPASLIPKGAETKPIPWTPMFNPSITPLGTDVREIWERCLSLPGLYGKVPRHNLIKIAYQALDGTKVEEEHRGFVAMLLQHECDHLDGILYPTRMTDMRSLVYASEVAGKTGFYDYSPEEFDGLPQRAMA